MIIIGITGTLGAGKSELASYLIQKGFAHFSAREFLSKEVAQRNLPVQRDSMIAVANDLRKKHSPSYVIESLFNEAQEHAHTRGQNCILESVRTPGEVTFLESASSKYPDCQFYLFAVDASPHLRYDRIKKRNSETDHVTFEKFIADEDYEMNSTDPNKANIAACMRHADFVLTNNTSLKDFHSHVEQILKEIRM
jgi:dephospho-CoA kinase